MSFGNLGGNKQKGLYLSDITNGYLMEMKIITGDSESRLCDRGVRELYFRMRQEYLASNLNWDDKLKEREKRLSKWQR